MTDQRPRKEQQQLEKSIPNSAEELKQLPSDHQSHSSIKSTRIPIYNGKRLF
ncbi:uncharacterized protein G2W53_004322 [Senna tora]|uniref:Uncharacterized protein n=1 Tax=Senna tora TaxID=362788 RepID=A0A835CH63_9FABA|nr:uncharacterized protein G2W53_004322 [Senna tora]